MRNDEPRWTIRELSEQASRALRAAPDYDGPPNDRIRETPDLRLVRYYTTLGLLDRALEFRGRTAFYGRRHLLQLAAIKRLQAQGMSLAAIQTRLCGLPDAELEAIARISTASVEDSRFERNAHEEPRTTARPNANSQRDDFWRAEPVPFTGRDSIEAESERDDRKESKDRSGDEAATAPNASRALRAWDLGEGAILLLPEHLFGAADSDSIFDSDEARRAAAPLLEWLNRWKRGPSP